MEPKTVSILFDVGCDYTRGIFINYKRFRTAESKRNSDPDPTDSDSEISDEDKYEEYTKVLFTLPTTNFAVYVIDFFPKSNVVYSKECNTKEECKKIYSKIFSQLHGSMPLTLSNKVTLIDDEIKDMPNILIADTIADSNGCYFIVALDTKGRVLLKTPLRPIW